MATDSGVIGIASEMWRTDLEVAGNQEREKFRVKVLNEIFIRRGIELLLTKIRDGGNLLSADLPHDGNFLLQLLLRLPSEGYRNKYPKVVEIIPTRLRRMFESDAIDPRVHEIASHYIGILASEGNKSAMCDVHWIGPWLDVLWKHTINRRWIASYGERLLNLINQCESKVEIQIPEAFREAVRLIQEYQPNETLASNPRKNLLLKRDEWL